MKKAYLFFVLILVLSCQKSEEVEISANLTILNCTLIDPNPVSGPVHTYGTYSGMNGFSCDTSTPCFPYDIFYNAPHEIWQQLEPAPNTRPSSNTLYDTHWGDTIWFYQVINNSNPYPTMPASDANALYEKLVCDILDHIATLPTLPSNQMYSIIFFNINVSYIFDPEDSIIDYGYRIYINNI